MLNWFYAFVALALLWAMLSAFLLMAPGRSDRSRRVGGFMLFGPLWFLLERELSRKMTHREVFGSGVVVFLMLVGFAMALANVL
jgi:hypothetical protein